VGVRAFLAEKLPLLQKYNTQVVVNVFGYCVEDYVEVIRRLEDAEGIAAYELNISCPNVKKGGMQFGNDPVMVAEVVGTARKAASRRPLWIKLTPLVSDIGLIAKAATETGADALTIANTYPAMAIDFRTGRSRIGNLTGGLSGPAIKPITLRLVYEVRKTVETPILGLGGVETVQDVLDYVTVGASAVQVGTASFSDPKVSEALMAGLERAVFELNCHNINDLRGKFLRENG
jgi:dihydroorotate dehydrogenase (NAD+) catalytic subunit